MHSPRPPRRWFSRLAVLSCTSILIAAVAVAVVLPVSTLLRERLAERDSLASQAERLAWIVAEGDDLDTLEENSRSRNVVDLYLDEETPELAFAELQGLVRDTLDQEGVSIQRVMNSHEGDERASDRVSVDLDFKATFPALKSALEAIEYGRPLIWVNRISVSASPMTDEATRYDWQPLTVRMTVSAGIGPELPSSGQADR